MKSKVVHLSSLHSSDDIRIFRKMCRTLVGEGYDVTFIVPCACDSTAAGVCIRALPPRTNRWTRLANLFRIVRAAIREQGSLYHFHDPELIPVGILLKLFGFRVIYDVHEDVPKQVLSKHWIPSPLRRIVSIIAQLVEAVGVPCWDGIVAATPSIASKFPQHKTVTVQNFPLWEETVQASPRSFAERPANVIYAGVITEQRGIHQLVAAMSHLSESLQVRLVLAGSVRPQPLMNELLDAKGWQHVDFQGWCAREVVSRLMVEARAGIVTFLPRPNHVSAQPNKLFEYMSAGLPVIASDFPLWRRIVEDVGCGILVNPERPVEISNAMEWLMNHPREAEDMGERGRRAVQEKYNWNRESEVLLDLYQRLLNEKSALPTGAARVCRAGPDPSRWSKAA